nr:winged helix-turn-helix transcriptional regulator [Nocardia brasiliensis]
MRAPRPLRRRERMALVARHRCAEAPPRPAYELTAAARDLSPPIYALSDLGRQTRSRGDRRACSRGSGLTHRAEAG